MTNRLSNWRSRRNSWRCCCRIRAALLADTLTHWHTNVRLLQVMIGWWLENRPVDVHQAFPSTFS